MKYKIFYLLIFLGGLLLLFYFLPVSKIDFKELYKNVDPKVVESLEEFRKNFNEKEKTLGKDKWKYIIVGNGKETILFLLGMTGYYDIWWQQINYLKERYRIISVTYPPIGNLEGLASGIMFILDEEGVKKFHIVGTSLGGYLTQYIATKFPDRIESIILSNTFPPNDLIEKNTSFIGKILPFVPEWIIIKMFRNNFKKIIYPASGNDDLTLAFLMELTNDKIKKEHLIARYHCVIQKFIPKIPDVPLMIIESDNDPLIDSTLREDLKKLYSKAKVYTFSKSGHFPYLNRSKEYNQLLLHFFDDIKKCNRGKPLLLNTNFC
jgi:pimeloyl-ACP methyl ester carboxylesterase